MIKVKAFIFLAIILIFSSCNKDELTKPADLLFTFKFSMENNGSNEPDYLDFTGGTILVRNIEFDGNRESGGDIYFESKFEETVVADLAAGKSEPEIKFDIPQGIYKKIEISVEIDNRRETMAGSCQPCEGKVKKLTLKYIGGLNNPMVRVFQRNDEMEVYSGNIMAGQEFSFEGMDKNGTLSSEIIIKINGQENTRIHTSCSKPIGPGLVSGDFEVTAGESRIGGELCSVDENYPILKSGLEIWGTYSEEDEDENKIPIRLLVRDKDEIELTGETVEGKKEIILDKNKPSILEIMLDPADWFTFVSRSSLEEADRLIINEESIILISPDFNEDLYKEVIKNIEMSAEAIFK